MSCSLRFTTNYFKLLNDIEVDFSFICHVLRRSAVGFALGNPHSGT